MIKNYSQNRANVILNFSKQYCTRPAELLNSDSFKKTLDLYIKNISKKDTLLYDKVVEKSSPLELGLHMISLFKLLLVFQKDEVKAMSDSCIKLMDDEEVLFEFIEGFYGFWRGLERYAIIESTTNESGIEDTNFIQANNEFNNLILSVYRRIEENLLGTKNKVYRQLKAGVNAGVVLGGYTDGFKGDLDILNGVSVVSSVVLNSPFIMQTKVNTRSGFFEEKTDGNPVVELGFNKTHMFMYPVYVGEYLTFVYFHRDYFNQGVALSNLFEMASYEDVKNKKPDIVYVYGAKNGLDEKQTVYYKDLDNDIYFGYVSRVEEIDYFGYMKKMLLTMHNVRQLDAGHLPIHGAMVKVTLKNGISKNICIMGDSGAGKSESLEAFRKVSEEYLKDMKIIFDDMGTFKIRDGKVYGVGTEIGAFVRLDDLDFGYAFSVIERALFMNIDQVNARAIIPVATYGDIAKEYEVDYFLYANNYEEDSPSTLNFYTDLEAAKEVFKLGRRKAKGTTSEVGIVESFFANPFGCLQQKEDSLKIIDKTFEVLGNHSKVGEIYTKLAVDGMEVEGPIEAAKELFGLFDE